MLIFTVSPYAEGPAELIIGPDEVVYYVSRYAVPSAWSKASPKNRYHLPDVDRETGHTLVHYLYKGSYETLEVTADAPLSGACADFARAILVYMVSSKYSGLEDLQRLAMVELKDIGQRLDICEVFGAIKGHFTKLRSDSWVHDYVFKKAKTEFAKDQTVFKSKNLTECMDDAYGRFLMRCMIDSYEERILHMAETERLLLEKLDEHTRASPKKLVKNTLLEEKAEGLEDFILPDVDDVDMKEWHGQDGCEQYSISTGYFSTIECSSSGSAASVSTEEISIEEAVVEEAVVEGVPVEGVPVEQVPVEEVAVEEANADEVPIEETAAEEATVEETIVEEAVVKESIIEEASVEEVPVEDVPVEEAAVEEAIVEEVSIEEAKVEKAIVEEPPIRQPCPRQAEHMLEEKRWKRCKSCRAVLHKVAIRLAQAS